MTTEGGLRAERIFLGDVELELYRSGGARGGTPLLFLHPASGFWPLQPYVGLLAAKHDLVVPSHPGFGTSSLPDWLDSVEDIAHIYLHLLDQLGLSQVDLAGCSLGGWIAAEMATKAPERFRRIVMVNPVGVKIGSREKLDIPDVFALAQDKAEALLFHDPAKMKVDYKTMPDEQVRIAMRNRESFALLVWEPYMHNPKLKHRLARVTNPTRFIHGASDGLVSAEYIKGYATLFPNASLRTISEAGHAPQMERPDAFVTEVSDFLNG
jgi:pimeloyl-ACP methyl ester carboxylesterase